MKQIRLVTGVPGAGKTTLMRQLTAEQSFVGLSVDKAYVHFIRDYCQPIAFPALRYYIAHHYDVILTDRLRSKAYLGRDFFAELGLIRSGGQVNYVVSSGRRSSL